MWRLEKGVYGLKQAAACWERELVHWLTTPPHRAQDDASPVSKEDGRVYPSNVPDAKQPLRGGCPIPFKRVEQDAKLFVLDTDKLLADPAYAAARVAVLKEHPDGVVTNPHTGAKEPFRYYWLIHVDDSRAYTNTPIINDIMMNGIAEVAGYKGKWQVTGGEHDLTHPDTPAEDFLSVTITYDGKSSRWAQPAYIPSMLRKHGYDPDSFHSVSTPMNPHQARLIYKARCPQTDADRAAEFKQLRERKLVPQSCRNYRDATTAYRSQVAGANWLACTTMPGIAFAVTRLASVQHLPFVEAFIALKHMMRFLAGKQDHEIVYTRVGDGEIRLYGECDASLGDVADTGDSAIGYGLRIGECGAYFAWKATRSSVVLLSTFGAELFCCSELARQVLGFRMMLESIGFPQPTTIIYSDSTSCVSNANARQNSSRNRSVRLRSWFVRSMVEQDECVVVHKPGAELACDGLTKAICSKDLYNKQWASMMGTLPQSDKLSAQTSA